LLDVFKSALDRHLAESRFPLSAIESVRHESTKLAAITPPRDLDVTSQQAIRHAIDESFVSAFRTVMAIGSALALASAIVALTTFAPKNC
jgi:hypothetical protein